ncbi:hypothetical protein CIRMBP1315_00745 [Enterococcus cecorum]|nr:hypothetical protein CIRMBP1315_00745 [Enterococcus cecorum]
MRYTLLLGAYFSPVWLFVSFFEIPNQILIYRVQKSRLTLSYQAFSDFWS